MDAHADTSRLLTPWPRLKPRRALLAALALAIYAWAMAGAEISPSMLAKGIPNLADFVSRMMPPAWKMDQITVGLPVVAPDAFHLNVPEVALAIVETLQMAIVGTSFTIVISLPFAFLAARNTTPHRAVYQATRFLLNGLRAIPELILALVFVAAVGLGPFAGVLALAFGAFGYTAKLYAEAIEAIDPQPVLALSATGATRAQTFVYGVLPQALPNMASFSILLFETSLRTATVLGIVGAGGVGFVLNKYIALFQYQNLMGAVVLIVIVVTCLDRLGDAIRKRLT